MELSTKKITIANHLRFDETIFPSDGNNSKENYLELFERVSDLSSEISENSEEANEEITLNEIDNSSNSKVNVISTTDRFLLSVQNPKKISDEPSLKVAFQSEDAQNGKKPFLMNSKCFQKLVVLKFSNAQKLLVYIHLSCLLR